MLVLRLLALPLLACRGVSPVEPPKVTWTDLLPEPGQNQAGQETFANSLPIGNGDMSALVSLASSNATDSATDVNVLLTLQSAWDELAAPYKVGLVTVTHKAPLSSMSSFSLDTSTGTTTVSFDNGETLTIFVDAAVNVLSVVSSASTPLSFSISNMRTSSESTIGPFGDCDNQTRSADVTTGDTFYHENNPDATYVATTLSRLNLDSIKDETWDPITGRASGGQVWSSANGTTVSIAALTSTSGAASLLSDLATLAASYTLDKAASDAVWEEFWSRYARGDARSGPKTCSITSQPPPPPLQVFHLGHQRHRRGQRGRRHEAAAAEQVRASAMSVALSSSLTRLSRAGTCSGCRRARRTRSSSTASPSPRRVPRSRTCGTGAATTGGRTSACSTCERSERLMKRALGAACEEFYAT